MQETGLLAKGAYMHVVFARNAASCINNSIHAAAALPPALQLLSGQCGKLPSKLEEAANWCGIPFEANRAHRALYDAQMTAELFRMMLAGDLAAQREAMSSQVKSPSDEKPLSSTLGGSCGGLAELLASLRAQELACA